MNNKNRELITEDNNNQKRVKLDEESEEIKPKTEVPEPVEAKSTAKPSKMNPPSRVSKGVMLEVILNDRLGKKIRVKCNSDDTVEDLKKLTAAQIGTRPEKLRIQKYYTVFKDHITLEDYEVQNGMSLELYYN